MDLLVSNLTKTYANGVKALDDLHLQIKPGMFGLLGPNGAGKSSLMRTIATLQNPDNGYISFNGISVLDDPMALRKVLGYLPQSFGVYPKVSALRLLDYFAVLKGIASKKDRQRIVQQVLELTNLFEVRKKSVSGYSGGMKQRFGIAQLLLNNPKLIIVDEPTAGLDPAERNRFLNVLREVGTKNTVIFSTHIVEDITELCTDMAIMNNGRILQQNTPSKAISEMEGKIWTAVIKSEQLSQFKSLYKVLSSGYKQDNTIAVRVFADACPDATFSAATPNLEDVYFIALEKDQTVSP